MKPIIISILLAMLAVNRVSIKVDRATFFAGGNLMVTCTVPRHPDNRKVAAVVVNYTSSERELNGEESPVTHRFEFKKIPCGVPEARCILQDKFGGTAVIAQTLEIAGCDGQQ